VGSASAAAYPSCGKGRAKGKAKGRVKGRAKGSALNSIYGAGAEQRLRTRKRSRAWTTHGWATR